MRKRFAALFLVCGAGAAQAFTIEDIEIRGLERIAEGTVLNYLPLERGDEVDAAARADAVESLFETGFFDDVQLLRDGGTLIIDVDERPRIAQIEFTGNEQTSSENLRDGLAGAGLGEGKSFDRSLLASIERELEQQYFGLGHYDIQVESTVSPMPENRVSLRIDIEEGEPASVQAIRFIGNQDFNDETLRDEFEMGPGGWFSWFSDRDRYSSERLSADLDRLERFYQDRGYADFSLESTQVTISPDRQQIHITVNVDEGQKYNVGEIELAGDLIFEASEIRELLAVEPGQTYNQQRIRDSVNALRGKLGERGYAFARINPVPDVRAGDREVDLTFFIDPAERVYVRQVRIQGNETTRDDVIRGEMRQYEGTWLSTSDLRESENRLGRTGFFGDVRVNTPRVPGTTDEVDIEVSTIERLSGSLSAGAGFGSDQGVTLNLGLRQDNVFGTGDRAEFVANTSDSDTVYRVSYLERNHTLSGIDRRWALSFLDREADELDLNDYGLESATASYGYRVPVSSNDRVAADLQFEEVEIDLPSGADPYLRREIDRDGDRNQAILTNVAWTRDTRNRAIFPTEGGRQEASLKVSLPGISDLEYYSVSYDQARFLPLSERFTLVLDGLVSYSDGYGETEVSPFYENYYAGGIRTVRGYDRNSLGPEDGNGDSVGGNVRVLGTVEVQYPLFADTDDNNLRVSTFVDGGQVWDRERDELGDLDEVQLSDVRYTAGFGLTYYSPVGPLSMSLARPLNEESGDDTQFFQFTIGASF